MFKPLAYMLQDKLIRGQINHFLMFILKNFSEIKAFMLEKYEQIEHSFPPMFLDRTIYEDENSDISL